MKLDGIHHVTAITGDAQGNVDFYAGVLGLRLVKKTVNQDDPTVYHLFYADEVGSAGADITFFEYPGAPPGRAAAGMIHRVLWRVGSAEALDFWSGRLADSGVEPRREQGSLRFADPEGLEHELIVADVADEPLVARFPGIPDEHALQGFHGVRAYSPEPEASRPLFEQALSFEPLGEGDQEAGRGGSIAAWEARGPRRGGLYLLDEPPAERGLQGAGTVHHVAWSAPLEEHPHWVERVAEGGARPTNVIDRFYFRSIYFREPSGVLFEIASLGPGFTSDEPLESLGERISLPPDYERLREQVEANLTPLINPRERAGGS